MTSKILKAIAISYLRFRKQYFLCGTEIGLFNSDVLCSNDKLSFEIEVKVSFSDFKADFKKEKHKYYNNTILDDKDNLSGYKIRKIKSNLNHVPNYFVFLVTQDIADDCLKYLELKPEYNKYGLATVKNVGAIFADNIIFLKKPKKLHNSAISENAKIVLLKRMSSELANFHIAQRYDIESANRLNQVCNTYLKNIK